MEIAIYAILALFIFSRLYSALGHHGAGAGKKKLSVVSSAQDKKMHNQDTEQDKFMYVANEDLDQIKTTTSLIKKHQQDFSTDKFIVGAERAFEIIIDAFSKGNENLLKPLLQKELFAKLKSKIEKRQNSGQMLEVTLIAITEKKLKSLKLESGMAIAEVFFASEQVIIQKDSQGNIIKGDTHHKTIVEDTWTFERKIKSASPAWVVSSMS